MSRNKTKKWTKNIARIKIVENPQHISRAETGPESLKNLEISFDHNCHNITRRKVKKMTKKTVSFNFFHLKVLRTYSGI